MGIEKGDNDQGEGQPEMEEFSMGHRGQNIQAYANQQITDYFNFDDSFDQKSG